MHSHIPSQPGLGSIVYAPSADKTAASQRARETRRALLRATAEEEEDGGGGWTVGGRSRSSSGGGSGTKRQPGHQPEDEQPEGNGSEGEPEPISMWA